MLRFLSRRRNRHSPMGPGTGDPHGAPAHHQLKDKNILPCRIILLDGTDLSVDLSVRVLFIATMGQSARQPRVVVVVVVVIKRKTFCWR